MWDALVSLTAKASIIWSNNLENWIEMVSRKVSNYALWGIYFVLDYALYHLNYLTYRDLIGEHSNNRNSNKVLLYFRELPLFQMNTKTQFKYRSKRHQSVTSINNYNGAWALEKKKKNKTLWSSFCVRNQGLQEGQEQAQNL